MTLWSSIKNIIIIILHEWCSSHIFRVLIIEVLGKKNFNKIISWQSLIKFIVLILQKCFLRKHVSLVIFFSLKGSFYYFIFQAILTMKWKAQNTKLTERYGFHCEAIIPVQKTYWLCSAVFKVQKLETHNQIR